MKRLVPVFAALVLATACEPSMNGTIAIAPAGSGFGAGDVISVEGRYYRDDGQEGSALYVWGEGGDAYFDLWKEDPNDAADLSSVSSEDYVNYEDNSVDIEFPDTGLASYSWTHSTEDGHSDYQGLFQTAELQISLDLQWAGDRGASLGGTSEGEREGIVSCVTPDAAMCLELNGALADDVDDFFADCESQGGTPDKVECEGDETFGICSEIWQSYDVPVRTFFNTPFCQGSTDDPEEFCVDDLGGQWDDLGTC